MRILEVVHGYPPARSGGTELYAEAHARALNGQGDEVVVLTREADTDRPDYSVRHDSRDGLRIISINNTYRGIRRFEETYRSDAIGAVAAQIIDDLQPDAAHIHHLTGLSTTIIGLLADRGVPCVVTLHDYWLMCHRGQLLDVTYRVCNGPGTGGCQNCLGTDAGMGAVGFAGAAVVRAFGQHLPSAAGRQLRHVAGRFASVLASASGIENEERRRVDHMREVCGQVSHFLAPSRFIRDRFVEFGVPPERITVSPNGAAHPAVPRTDFASRMSLSSGAGPLRLGFLGSLMISKGPHILLEAAAQLPPGSVSVDLVGALSDYHGDDSYRDRLAPLLAGDGVRAQGAIPHAAVPLALATIDVLVVPSIWPENAPLVIQEAFLAGLPVVAARIGGIPEMVTDGVNGLLVTAGDVFDLSRALMRLLVEPDLIAQLRAGIPQVRTIEDDVRFARQVYRSSRRQ